MNAINSIKNLDYDNFELVIIDDGSEHKIKPIVETELSEYKDKIKLFETEDSIEQKLKQGGSRHGEYMNKAILESDSDYVIILCDDDALVYDYLTNLNKYFNEHNNEKYCYSHVIVFNPYTENPFEKEKSEHWLNRTDDLNPVCQVDSTQVCYSVEAFKIHSIRYPSLQTKNLDAHIYTCLFQLYNVCKFTGFNSQYKAFFEGQLGECSEEEQYRRNTDIK